MIKVIIRRKIGEDLEPHYTNLAKELLQQTISAEGYHSGELLRDVYDPSVYITISVWRSLTHWERWARSPTRHRLLDRLAHVLDEPETTQVVENI